jgi:hypothetical protein
MRRKLKYYQWCKTDSQSSLIRGGVSVALQDARGEAVSMTDMMFSSVSMGA